MIPTLQIGGLGRRRRATGGAPPSTYTTLNPSDTSTRVTLSGGNLVATCNTNGSGISRSIKTITGKKYFEMVFTAVGGSSGAVIAAGIANGSAGLDVSLGYGNANGWAFWGVDVGARHNGATAVAGVATNGDVFGFAVDEVGHKLWIRKNGTWIGTGSPNPATDTAPNWSNLSGTLYAAACPWGMAFPTIASVTARFDPASFRDAAPSGFDPITA